MSIAGSLRFFLPAITLWAALLSACGTPADTGTGGQGGATKTTTTTTTTSSTTTTTTTTTSSTTTSGTGGSGGAEPDGAAELGKECKSDADCGPLLCLETTPGNFAGAGPQGGLCSKACGADGKCPPGGVCIGIGNKGYCSLECVLGPDVPDKAKCLGRDDMACSELMNGGAACFPMCTSNAGCGASQYCNYGTGLCADAPPAGDPMGKACDPNEPETCSGVCMCQDAACATGACAGFCAFGRDGTCGEKEGTGLCLLTFSNDPGAGDVGMCVGDCMCDGDCAPGFVCNGFVEPQAVGKNGVCYADLNGQTFPQCCSCEGKLCGDDGCGTSCGGCAAGESCTSAGACCTTCGAKECGDDGCGGTCGACAANEVCDAQGQCQCVPDCNGKVCGSDGCGGTCGACAANEVCNAGACCAPDCNGKQCGSNLCGGTCGSCAANQFCNGQNQCQCQPACAGKTCGPDGCGGTCGSCGGSQVCNGGSCCAPSCAGKNCGSDGCGGTCGTCNGVCNAGVCCQPQLPCFNDSHCCGQFCGIVSGSCHACLPLGEYCASGGAASCCSGLCEAGQCVSCLSFFESCTSGSQCCSNKCGPNGYCIN